MSFLPHRLDTECGDSDRLTRKVGMPNLLSVIEPATERELASLPRAAGGGCRRRGRPGKGGVSRLARVVACRPRGIDCAVWPTRWRPSRGAGASSRRATRASRSATRAARSDGGRDDPLLRRRARAAARRHDPRGRGRGAHVPRAARRRRADRAVELPARDRRVEAGPGAGGGEHGRAQAGRAHAADGAASSRRSRSRPACPRAWSTSSPGRAACAGGGSPSTPTWRRSPSPARRRSGAGIAAAAAETIKRVTLELGGKSANIVFADSDLERAAAAAPMAVFGNAGQDCCARSRILVERPVLDRFMEALEEAVEALRVGDPLDEATQMGPLISAGQREQVASFVNGDAPVAIRGSAPEGPGYWFPPTVLCPVANDDRAAREEIFGPGGLRDPVQRGGRGGRAGQRHDLRPLRLDLDPRRRAGRCAWRGRWRPASCP